nr:MAG TPA: chromosome segregation ATPase [Caudoviricetes sp.]
MIRKTPTFDYNSYQSERERRAAELGLTTDLTAAELRAMNEAPAIGQDRSNRLQNLLENKQALYEQGLDEDTINRFQKMALDSDDPEAMEGDMLSAIAFSRNLGISVTDAYNNLDSLMDAQFFNPQQRGKTTWKAINDSFALGELTTQRGELGYKLMSLDPDGDEYQSLMAELQNLNTEIEARQDYLPRNWATTILKYTGNTVPYTMKSTTAGMTGQTIVQGALTGIAAVSGINTALAAGTGMLAATGVGLPIAGMIATAGLIANRIGSFQYGTRIEGGNQYLDLLEQGLDHKTASKISYLHGMISSGIEQTLESAIGGVSTSLIRAAGVDAGGIASKVISKSIVDGKLSNRLLQFGLTYSKDVIEEGLEEAFQGLSADLTKNLAFVLSDLDAPVDFSEAMQNMFQEAIGGMAGSLILGAFGAAGDVRMTKDKAIYLKALAANVKSKESFREKSSEVLESSGIEGEAKQKVQDAIWAEADKSRNTQWNRVSDALIDSSSITETPTFDSEGNQITASWDDKNEVFQLDEASYGKSSDEQSHTIRFGNLNERGYAQDIAEVHAKQERGEQLFGNEHDIAQQKRQMQMVQGASISFTTKGDSLTIDSVSIADGMDESVREKAVRQLISIFPDYDISWNAETKEDISIRDSIISQNPRGSQYGLNLQGRGTDSESVQYVKRWLGNKFSQDDTENSVMAMTVEAMAKRYGLSGQQFIEKYAEDIQSIRGNKQAEALITANGEKVEDVKGFISAIKDAHDNVRAVIYAGEHADLSTFQHEMHHLVMAIGENKQDFRNSLESIQDTAQFKRFLAKNLDIIGSVRGQNGKIDEAKFSRIMEDLKQDEWTAEANEFETELFNAWQREGKSLNKEMNGIFQRIAEGIRKVFSILRRNGSGVELNKEISDYYDRLFGYDPEGKDKGKDFSSWKYSPDKNVTPIDASKLKKQGYTEQADAVRKHYEGTDAYLKTPDGKATSLSPDMWIDVRTPAFKELFGDWENDPASSKVILDESGEPAAYDYFGNGQRFYMMADNPMVESVSDFAGEWNPMTNQDLRDYLIAQGLMKEGEILSLSEALKRGGKSGIRYVRDDGRTGYILANPADAVPADRSEFIGALFQLNNDNNEERLEALLNKAPKVAFMIAYHGSPNEITEALSTRYIGTGEGAQVHGWGLYFAEDKKVSDRYRSKLLTRKGKYAPIFSANGVDVSDLVRDYLRYDSSSDISSEEFRENLIRQAEKIKEEQKENYKIEEKQLRFFEYFRDLAGKEDLTTRQFWTRYGKEYDAKLEEAGLYGPLRKYMPSTRLPRTNDLQKIFSDHADYRKKGSLVDFYSVDWSNLEVSPNEGSLFEVDLPDYEELLDEQQPLSNQNPYVVQRLKDLWMNEFGKNFEEEFGEESTGSKIYHALSNMIGSREEASLLLDRYGVKGITYKGLKDGRCFVIFNGDSIKSQSRIPGILTQLSNEAESFRKIEERLRANPANFDSEGNHLAPNGQKSNLSYRQWVQVRTPEFKNWFGDWETVSDDIKPRLKNLIRDMDDSSLHSEISVDMAKDKKDLEKIITRESKNRRGEIFCPVLGRSIQYNRNTIKEVLHHDYRNEAHLASVYYIPEFIQKGKLLANVHDASNNREFSYLVSKFNYGDRDYLVRSVIKRDGDSYYYDHKLSNYKKFEELIDELLVTSKDHPSSLLRNLVAREPAPLYTYEDNRLLSVLQGFSKVVDENGEPLVMYHGSSEDFDIFETGRSGENWGGYASHGIGSYFTSDYDDAVRYAKKASGSTFNSRVYPVFLNIRNPFTGSFSKQGFRLGDKAWENLTSAKESLSDYGYDGYFDDAYKEGRSLAVITDSNQVKSATDNNGDFSVSDPSILTQTVSDNESGDDIILITQKKAESSAGLAPSEWDYAVIPADASEDSYSYLSSNGIQAIPYNRSSSSDRENKFNTAIEAERIQRQKSLNGYEKIEQSENGNYYIERLSKEEADTATLDAEHNAETVPAGKIFSAETWNEEFHGFIADTTVGKVKLGQHQFDKLIRKSRTEDWVYIKPTLERPSLIIAEVGEDSKETYRYVFVKAFRKECGFKWFYSVVVSKDEQGLFSISNRATYRTQVRNKLIKNLRAISAAELSAERRNVQNPQLTAVLNNDNNINGKNGNSNLSSVLFQSISDDVRNELYELAYEAKDYKDFVGIVTAMVDGDFEESDLQSIFIDERGSLDSGSSEYDLDFDIPADEMEPPDEDIDFMGAEDTSSLYPTNPLENYTDEEVEELQKSVATAFQVVKGTVDVPDKYTLNNPDTTRISVKDKNESFDHIIGTDEGILEYLNGLRLGAEDTLEGTNIGDIYDASTEEGAEIIAGKEQFKDDLLDKAAPLIRAYVYKMYGGKDAALGEYSSRFREHKKLTASDISSKTMKSIRGIIRNNLDFYRNLYANATAESYWKGMPTLEEMFNLEGAIANDNSLSISALRKLSESIQDEKLRDSIIRGGKADLKEIRSYLARAKEREESFRKETELAKEISESKLESVNGELRRVTAEGIKAQQELIRAENELESLKDQLEKKANSLARTAKARGLSAEEVQDQQELAKKLAYAERLRNQKKQILSNLYKDGKYYGDAGRKKAAEIDAKLAEVVDIISELQKRKIVSAEEAVDRLVDLSEMIGADKIEKAVSDAVMKERLKAANAKARMKQSQEQKLKESVADAVARTTARYQKREDILKKEYQNLKDAYRNRIAARKLRDAMMKMADRIMRPASHTMDISEADKLIALQNGLDPNFRSSIRANGRMMDIGELKRIYRSNPSDPALAFLSENQIQRLSKKSLDEMSLSELNKLYEESNRLRELGRAKRQAYLAEHSQRISTIRSGMIDQITSRADYKPPEIGGSVERKKMLRPKLREIQFATLTMPTKAQLLDGNKKGLFYDFLVRKKRACQKEERSNIFRRSDPVVKMMDERKIDNAYWYTNTREVALPGISEPRTYTYSDLAYIYLSRNNQRNVEAVSYGTLVTKEEKAVLINSAEKRIIGGGRDALKLRNEMIDGEIRKLGDARYKVLLDEAIETVEGNPDLLAIVEAIESDLNDKDNYKRICDSVEKRTNQHVEREDYYLPINRNDYKGETPSDKVQNDLLNQYDGKGRPAIDRGFTKSRITISPRHQPSVNIDLFGVWQNSVYNQEHLIAFGDYVADLNAVFENKGHDRDFLLDAISSSEKLGKSVVDDIKAYIAAVANPELATASAEDGRISSLFRIAKGGIYSGYLGFKLSAVVMQAITSPAAFMGKVNPLRLGNAMFQLISDSKRTYEKVYELSPFMRSRSFDLIKDEIKRAASDSMNGKFSRKYQEILNFGMEGLEWIDKYCVTAGWKAIYDQEIIRLGGETDSNIQEAVRIADEYVSETQPLTDPTELAPYLLKGGEAMKFFTQFRASLNVIWNNAYVNGINIWNRQNMREAWGMTVGYIGAGILVALVRGELTGDDDDEDKNKVLTVIRNIIFASTSQFVEAVPLLGDPVSSIVSSFIKGEYEEPYDSSTFPAASKLAEAFGRVSEYINTPAQERNDKMLNNAVKSVAEGTGLALGLPVSSYKDVKRVFDNKDEEGWGKAILALFGRRSF